MSKKKQKKARKRTLVALVLDSSGSMSSMKEEAIGLFNAQRGEIVKGAKSAGETLLSLVVFGTYPQVWPAKDVAGVEVKHANVPPNDVPRLTEDTYTPQAMTPMRDGIGRAIQLLEAEDDGGKDTACLVIVVTDGMENVSREWTAEALSAKVVALQNTGRWTFALYGCADLDLAELKDTAGLGALHECNVGTYARGAVGMASASAGMSVSTRSYMTDRAAGVTATEDFAAGGEAEDDA